MNTQEKQQIAQALNDFCNRKGNQNKAANALKGVSGATITQVLKGNWDSIADKMWRLIKAQIFAKEDWVCVETAAYQTLTALISDAQEHSQVYAIIAPAGSGKTKTMQLYEKENPNAYMVQCNEFWNKKAFMGELLAAMGRDSSGLTVNEMVNEAVRVLKSTETPVILLDEFDKVNDQVLYFFITLYNLLEEHCGIVMCATDFLEKRIKRGLKLNKKGYKEIYSRIGRNFIEVTAITQADCIQICTANGITTKTDIKAVWADCEGDLRRVKRKVHALKLAHLEATND